MVEKNSPMLKTKQLNRFSVSLKQTVANQKILLLCVYGIMIQSSYRFKMPATRGKYVHQFSSNSF
jgi:hypothetical protein